MKIKQWMLGVLLGSLCLGVTTAWANGWTCKVVGPKAVTYEATKPLKAAAMAAAMGGCHRSNPNQTCTPGGCNQ